MATLVLTALGTAIGGPIGGAIGAALGRQADAVLFRPAAREGPRLSDLRVQLSQYGTQIPKIFGVMRIAGTVIWASDLIEHRARQGGGKGRAATLDYSYTTSLAIALSSRPILGVRRIWADGNILRGAAGEFKERTLFRIYRGDADQAADPLIASAVGIANASAFRGIAYVVLEDLELANFGNRIPSLTFEIEADQGVISSLAVARTLLDDQNSASDDSFVLAPNDLIHPIDRGNTDSSDDPLQEGKNTAEEGEDSAPTSGLAMLGYAAAGRRVRDALDPLIVVDKLRMVTRTDGVHLARSDQLGAAQDLILAQHSAPMRPSGQSHEPVPIPPAASANFLVTDHITERRRVPLSSLPRVIMLRHYEPERDYQLGQQRVPVAQGGMREQHIDLPAVVTANQARAQAHRLAIDVSDGREMLSLTSDFSALSLSVGGLVRGVGLEGSWRLAQRKITGSEVVLDLVSHRPLALTLEDTAAGTAVLAPDYEAGAGRVVVFDLPPLGEVARSTARRLIVGAGEGPGWRGADLWLSSGAEQESIALGILRPARALGRLEETLGGGDSLVFDEANSALVRLSNNHMTLVSAEDSALAARDNLAVIDDEIIQFGRAEMIAPALWRLSRLIRGQQIGRGARHESGNPTPHPVGSDFTLLDDSAHATIPDMADALTARPTATIEWAVRGSFMLQKIQIPSTRAAIRPLSPVHGAVQHHADGSATLRWIRRSRLGWLWRDRIDTPFGESTLLFRVAVPLASGGESLIETSVSTLTLSIELRARMSRGASVAVRQVGDFDTSQALLIAVD